MNSAVLILGPQLASRGSVELCCVNTEVWFGASAVIAVPHRVLLGRCALRVCVCIPLKGMLKALL